MKSVELAKSVIISDSDKGVITFQSKYPNQKLNTREETREEIIKLIRDNPSITMKELAIKLSISAKGIEWHIKRLKEENILKRHGATKKGYWEVIEK